MKKVLFYLLMTNFIALAQDKVNSTPYNWMLKSLLSHSVKDISVSQVDTLKDVVYLDARTREEFEVSHIKKAIWVGYDDFDLSKIKAIQKDQNIVVYCAVGYRSEKIAEKLDSAGYDNVSNLYGGIFEWKNQGKPVYKDDKITNKVHAYSKLWGIWLQEGEKVY